LKVLGGIAAAAVTVQEQQSVTGHGSYIKASYTAPHAL